MSTGAHGSQRYGIPAGAGVLVIACCPEWMLGTYLGPCARAGYALTAEPSLSSLLSNNSDPLPLGFHE